VRAPLKLRGLWLNVGFWPEFATVISILDGGESFNEIKASRFTFYQ